MKTKKLVLRLIVLLGLLILLVVPASPAAADTPVSIGVPAMAPENSNFIARVNIGSVTDFDAAQYDITYDPAVIEVTSVTDGLIGATPIPVSSWGYIPASTQGTIRVINNVDGTPGVTGSGYLAEIHFHVVGATGTSSAISLEGGVLGDKNAQQIPATWAGGSVNVVTAVTADFTADVTEVLVNQAVAFTANPAGGSGSYTYAWDFGDSGTSTAANPTHSYAASGTYTVSLTVTDTFDGSDTKTRTDYITVYAALDAGFTANIREALVGENITFNSGATVGGKPGYTYAWSFGDSGTSTAANPTHNYAAPGTYTVSLVVTDSLSNNNTETKNNYITVYAALVAGFSANIREALVGQTITFNSNATVGGKLGYTYAWSFGDSGTSTAANPTHSYAASGNYTVSLTVTDSLGNNNTRTRTNYITVYAALVASFSADINEAVVGQTITFNSAATAGGKPGYTYIWSFGDSGNSTMANPTHSYTDSGAYTVSLKVTDSLGNFNDSSTVSVTVYKLGDADKNGTVNVLDLTCIEHIIMGDSGYVYTTWADAKPDGNMNALDITAVELIIIP